MTGPDALDYHRERAEQERGRARDAGCVVAARAHAALAELHEERLRALSDETAPPRPTLHAAYSKAG